MIRILLVLRPQPGAERTAARARGRGFDPVVAPLFEVRPVAWSAPDPAAFDAVMLTSANAIRHGGPAIALYRHLPIYAVGAMTAAAAGDAGFHAIVTGAADGAALLARAEADGRGRLLHLAGRDHRPAEREGVRIERRVVYASEALDRLPDPARDALAAGAVALLHSARAAATFRALAEAAGFDAGGLRIAAISAPALAAAGPGWRASAAAARPTDAALLAAAARLCD
jgi:uroporphyrinogen-III synthase